MSQPYQPSDPKGAILAFNQGVEAIGEGREQEAVTLWRKALELDPALAPAARNLITFHQDSNDLSAELEIWQALIDYDPFDTDNLVLQAAALFKANMLPEAVANYLKAISIYPYFKFWYQELATIYTELGETDDAELWKGRGASLGADEAEMAYEDGVRHAKEERWTSARFCLEAVLEEFPANLDARLRLAKVLENAGSASEVVGQYQLALDLSEMAKGLVQYRLGDFYFRTGELENAAEAFRQAHELEGVFHKAGRALRLVEQKLNPQPVAVEPLQAAQTAPVQPPNPRLHWEQQVRQVLDQVLSIDLRDPRIAVVAEPDPELAGAVDFAVAELRALGRQLRSDAEVSQVFVIEAHGSPNGSMDYLPPSGWLGQHNSPTLDTTQWSHRRPGLELERCLRSIYSAADGVPFNCIFVFSFGRVANSPDVSQLLAQLPAHCLCFVHPAYHYVDIRSRVGPEVANFLEITIN